MSGKIMVLCPTGLDEGLLSKAVSLSPDGLVRVLVPKCDAAAAAELGAALIHTLPKDFELQNETLFARWLAERVPSWGSRILLAPATVQMRNMMPILAWYLDGGLTADCTDLSMEGDRLLQIRPAFGNSLMATIRAERPVQMATVRPGTFPVLGGRLRKHRVIREIPQFSGGGILQEGFVPFEGDTPLSQARIVIAGGLGIGSKEGFEKLRKLAALVGGAVGASRSAVNAGFAPYHCQIGMTGITVCPELYIAIGISGAVQHLAGMSGAERVIAVNSDSKAPIFDYADYGVVGDWEVVVDKMISSLEEAK